MIFDCNTKNLYYHNDNSVVIFNKTQLKSLFGDGYAEIRGVDTSAVYCDVIYDGVLDVQKLKASDILSLFRIGAFVCLRNQIFTKNCPQLRNVLILFGQVVSLSRIISFML